MSPRCSAEWYGYGDNDTCDREVDEQGLHTGHHFHRRPGKTHGNVIIAVWTRGGHWAVNLEESAVCEVCGTYERLTSIEGGVCETCRSWYEGLDAYLAGRDIVIRGTVYRRSQYSGAFGDSPTHILTDSGVEYNDTRTWHVTDVPEEYRDLWRDNARFLPREVPADRWGSGRPDAAHEVRAS